MGRRDREEPGKEAMTTAVAGAGEEDWDRFDSETRIDESDDTAHQISTGKLPSCACSSSFLFTQRAFLKPAFLLYCAFQVDYVLHFVQTLHDNLITKS